MSKSYLLTSVAVAGVFAAALCAAPFVTNALSKDADAMCDTVIPACKCGTVPGKGGCVPGMNKFMCPPGICQDHTNGHTTLGTCIAVNDCKGISADGQGLDSGLSQLGKMLGDLMSKLMQPKSGSGGGEPPPPPPSPLNQGCTQYFQTTDISQLSNPCAQYGLPPATNPLDLGTGTSTDCDPVSQMLGMCAQSGSDNGTGGTVDTSGGDTGTTSTSSTRTPRVLYPSVPTGANVFLFGPGVRGDIKILTGGATILAGSRDEGKNTEVAGFLGGGAIGQPQSLVAQWCQDRPWATNFLSAIIPPDFFDNLCTARGYQVGLPAASSAPVVESVRKPKTATSTNATTTPTIKSKVDIWATPASVPLGGRTSIFWNTQGVTACTETSADGNFNQNSLSGGAATVALTGATTFTINCTAPDGSTATNSVTVNLKI